MHFKNALTFLSAASLALASQLTSRATGCGHIDLPEGLPSECYNSNVGCQYDIISQPPSIYEVGLIGPDGNTIPIVNSDETFVSPGSKAGLIFVIMGLTLNQIPTSWNRHILSGIPPPASLTRSGRLPSSTVHSPSRRSTIHLVLSVRRSSTLVGVRRTSAVLFPSRALTSSAAIITVRHQLQLVCLNVLVWLTKALDIVATILTYNSTNGNVESNYANIQFVYKADTPPN